MMAGSELSSNVLLVEDEELTRAMLVEFLHEVGFSVISVCSADEACAVLDAGRTFDLLITDVVTPGNLNGFDLADRAKTARPALKVLYMSGYHWAASQAYRGPIHGELLSKPFRPSDLVRAAERALQT